MLHTTCLYTSPGIWLLTQIGLLLIGGWGHPTLEVKRQINVYLNRKNLTPADNPRFLRVPRSVLIEYNQRHRDILLL